MRILFSLAGLLIVLAIVAWLARTQLKAVTTTVAPAAAPAAGEQAPTVPEQSRQLQRQIQQDIGRALEQGARRASESQP
jgi:Tfp pilus assembly major pilin PilA